MDLTDSPAEAAFRREVRDWLGDHLTGEFADARGLGGPGSEHEAFEVRLAWDRLLADGGWTCLGWPVEHGGRGASTAQQMIFHEEYARAAAPVRVGHVGEELLGPTLIAFGTEQQRRRFLPEIVAVRELWCQGYSEPSAGSDLANVSTRARRDGPDWVIDGQKTWTSLAHQADWCFLLARTGPPGQRHRGLSCLLLPMDRPGVEVRPIVQLTGTSEFNEVFFDGARTAAEHVVGEVGDGWRVAMGTLGFERGVGTIDQQVVFRRELERITDLARRNGAMDDPVLRDKITRAWIGLEVMRFTALRTLTGVAEGTAGPEASIAKLHWATFHRGLGELAVEVAGACGLVAAGAPYELDEGQRLFLFSRADTIYGGSNEIQRTIIAERVLGLPKEARP
ncbi:MULTISPECIES: acyl-CoA dehydrogenase family protein [unclassified Saccharopolyspora]|uniref:acyl-CoA dehydrogenase family protein n=1 Tax=unclassified Saccharopolyspora TaxID=2646250 RepID=UPI001CD6D212|nr:MULTISPECIES: acyl-CoA dehydrogenase family protein [unclassified Saccharopolyspora]MCA1189460.1 acyl-CoA dehydrogenase family protein [Saccharopolyspora sp. 6T]MCA1193766.1 acyl-CoA dehydrogenase family protein [Saccharopolyspora sp. 6V]